MKLIAVATQESVKNQTLVVCVALGADIESQSKLLCLFM